MSKLGKKPIIIPKDTKVKIESGKLLLTGPKGSRELTLNDKIFSATVLEDKSLILKLMISIKFIRKILLKIPYLKLFFRCNCNAY